MSVRQACPSWQATLPPADLGEERQVSDQVCGATKLRANASTDAVVAGELILSSSHMAVTSIGRKSSQRGAPSLPSHCSTATCFARVRHLAAPATVQHQLRRRLPPSHLHTRH